MAEVGAGNDGGMNRSGSGGREEGDVGNDEKLGKEVAVFFQHEEDYVVGGAGKRDGCVEGFAEFTGGAVVSPRPGDRVFVVAGDQVVPVP